MATVHYTQSTTTTPERFIAGLTDFGPGRDKLFGHSADSYLRVHGLGTHEANVTEGSGGGALHTLGNACTTTGRTPTAWSSPRPTPTGGAASRATPTPSPPSPTGRPRRRRHRPRGQEPQRPIARLILGTVGKSKLENAFRNSVKAIDSRNYAVAATDSRTPTTSAAS